MKKKVLLINGPNLNLLGTRETDIYGSSTLEQIVQLLQKKFTANNIDLVAFQSNSEGKIVDFLHQERKADYVIINPAAYSHTSIAIHDAFLAVQTPFIEVHISNIYRREEFRHHSYFSAISQGMLCGFGIDGYFMAADFVIKQLQ